MAAEEAAARSRCPDVHAHLNRSTSSCSRFSTLVISTLRKSPDDGGSDPGPSPAPPASPGAAIISMNRDRHRDPINRAAQEAPPSRGANAAM